jgi:hypothetical protein
MKRTVATAVGILIAPLISALILSTWVTITGWLAGPVISWSPPDLLLFLRCGDAHGWDVCVSSA